MAPQIETLRAPSATDLIYADLFRKIVGMQILPGTKISEIEIAKQHDVSRQPVRDAFYRLSQQGLLRIRPQRATVVTHISIGALREARFVRVALEKEVVRIAAHLITPPQIEGLKVIMDHQRVAISKGSAADFYHWDEVFHADLCEISGQPGVWSLICDTKAPADRVRFLSLAFDSEVAMRDHEEIFSALVAGAGAKAAEITDTHLSRVLAALPRIQQDHAACFEETH